MRIHPSCVKRLQGPALSDDHPPLRPEPSGPALPSPEHLPESQPWQAAGRRKRLRESASEELELANEARGCASAQHDPPLPGPVPDRSTICRPYRSADPERSAARIFPGAGRQVIVTTRFPAMLLRCCSAFRTRGSAMSFCSHFLPLIHVRHMQPTLMSLVENTCNALVATRVAVPTWRCALYPLAVLAGAVGKATGLPAMSRPLPTAACTRMCGSTPLA